MLSPNLTHPRWLLSAPKLAWLSMAILATSGAAFAAPPIKHYTGTAFDLNGREIYTESHWISGDSRKTERLILFQCPDGEAFARKHVEEAGESTAPLFELDDGRYGYREGVRLDSNGKREVFVRRKTDQAEQSAMVDSVPRLVIDAGFDRFITMHWDELIGGRDQKVEFLLPSRLRTYTFVVSHVAADSIDGKPVQRFRLELDSWFGFALPAIDMAYTTETRAIREYSGVSNIRDNDGKNLKVRIEFPDSARSANVDPKTLADAEAVRLDGRCKL